MDRYIQFLKNSWWVFLIPSVLLALYLIPASSGLPSNDYRGCEVKEGTCQYSTLKSVTRESDGSATIIIPAKLDGKNTEDLAFHLLRFNKDWITDGKVVLNFMSEKKQVYLFVETRTNMFSKIIYSFLNTFQAPMKFDANGQQIKD